jgi:hypothetical protein
MQYVQSVLNRQVARPEPRTRAFAKTAGRPFQAVESDRLAEEAAWKGPS